MGRKGCSALMLLLLFNAVAWMEAEVQITIYFPPQKLTWEAAREYCQKYHIDMVTWNTVDPNLLTTWLLERGFTTVWIGLHEDPEESLVWRWINVKTGEGLTGDDVSASCNGSFTPGLGGSCGSYNSLTKQWEGIQCFLQRPFICYADNLVVVTENKTWEDALSHCREMTNATFKYDLLSVTNSSDYGYVSDRIYRATTDEVWTGLRFLGGEWWWSDGKTLDHQEMLPDCPNQRRHCGTVSKCSTPNRTSRDCSERRNFICSHEKVANRDKNVLASAL
ncbi:macrophage mannose receptor 1-like [Poeciliopsis prolifica]|uniref:macrophage mannose receptor 1-like n=1 Tax=Poeciliopsis prolifica TaxID=188132 RepID=UPI002413AB20|nr:macrophage mannose receptor 1-like [Poeciliopsis prolifica]